jgi:hypothetical protein
MDCSIIENLETAKDPTALLGGDPSRILELPDQQDKLIVKLGSVSRHAFLERSVSRACLLAWCA